MPCLGAVLHTLNLRLHAAELAYIIDHAADAVTLLTVGFAVAAAGTSRRIARSGSRRIDRMARR